MVSIDDIKRAKIKDERWKSISREDIFKRKGIL